MDIVNPNYMNYMEQIQKNREDIEKLYDQELSDITQLNFKEDDENGLEYENGKAIFYGKSSIIRDENTNNLEVDSKVELKISSGDDDIVIDAGEDNSTLEIHLDNETRNKINRSLLTPISSPTTTELVGINPSNSQARIELDTETLSIENDKLGISQAYKGRLDGTMEYFLGNRTSTERYPSNSVVDSLARGMNNYHDIDFDSLDSFTSWIQNDMPQGVILKYCRVGSSPFCYVILKVSSQYASYLKFNYGEQLIKMNRLVAGNWLGEHNV